MFTFITCFWISFPYPGRRKWQPILYFLEKSLDRKTGGLQSHRGLKKTRQSHDSVITYEQRNSCFTSVALVSAVQLSESNVFYISPLFGFLSFQVLQAQVQSSLCHTASSHQSSTVVKRQQCLCLCSSVQVSQFIPSLSPP